MSEEIVARFKNRLQRTEETREPEHVAELFAPDANLANLGGDHGNDPAGFWRVYLDQFSEIRSEFIGEIVSRRSAALEWRSTGKTADGQSVDYRGVSLIEWEEDRLVGFRTYYDSAAFVRGS